MIEICNLSKSFNGLKVIDDVNLTIPKGEYLSLLGPNGAGKTTLIKMISTLLVPDSGQILVDGQAVGRENKEVKKKFSVLSQEYSLRNDFTVLDIMEQHGRLYDMPKNKRVEKTRELLNLCGLYESRNKTARQLSGGMKRKLMLCRALMTDPEYLMLDEPTVGLDPMSRRQMWSILYKLNESGITIILTTHYIEEAQYLSRKVALIDKGQIKTVQSPDELIRSVGNYTVECFENGNISAQHFNTRDEAVKYISALNCRAALRETNLEDVFIKFAGKGIADDGYTDSALGKMG